LSASARSLSGLTAATYLSPRPGQASGLSASAHSLSSGLTTGSSALPTYRATHASPGCCAPCAGSTA